MTIYIYIYIYVCVCVCVLYQRIEKSLKNRARHNIGSNELVIVKTAVQTQLKISQQIRLHNWTQLIRNL